MSADNGYAVRKVQGENNLYGIFHYFASDESVVPATRDRAAKLYSHPVAAILGAFRLEYDNEVPTEYGITVTGEVLQHCRHYFTDAGWEVKK
jgi:hypothetical protein